MDPPLELVLKKESFRFSAAHFISHDGGRERLHGHNYRVAVALQGGARSPGLGLVGGYLLDFRVVKKAVRAVCDELHERFLCPSQSPTLGVVVRG